MGLLPGARNTTYVSGVTPVKGNDLNDLQDQILALNKLLTAQSQANWSLVQLAIGLTLAANQHVTVSGTGQYKHGLRTLHIPLMTIPFQSTVVGGFGDSAAADGKSAVRVVNDSAPIICVTFQLPSGKRILTTRARIFDNTSPQSKLKVGLSSAVAPASAGTPLLPALSLTASEGFFGGVSAGTGAKQVISSAAINTIVDPDTVYGVNVQLASGISTYGFVTDVFVDYDEP